MPGRSIRHVHRPGGKARVSPIPPDPKPQNASYAETEGDGLIGGSSVPSHPGGFHDGCLPPWQIQDEGMAPPDPHLLIQILKKSISFVGEFF